MASTSSANVNELLPGLEEFLRSMLNTTSLDTDHRHIATMYLDKIDHLSQLTNQQTSIIDDQSLMNTDIISEEESDDFTDEDEQQQQVTRHSSICDDQLYNSLKQKSSTNNSQWYIDIPKDDCSQLETSNKHNENSSLITSSRLSSLSSSIIADGLLLTYDKDHNWIWRYYVLDDFDLICFPADKKSRSIITQDQSDKNCSPLWVSDMSNAKVHITVIDKIECLCLQVGLAEAIYVRPSDPNQMNIWLKAFRDAASSKKSKDNSKNRSNKRSLSRNARRMFARFNRKKGQIVSHLLDQMANVTGVDDKTRKHCELRGFLVISHDNSTFVTKYCTIVDGIFRIHKSRLSEQTDHELILNNCTLSFPEERTRDIQFALINQQIKTIFIRGNNIYTMGRLLNTLSKYVEIKGSSQTVFKSTGNNTSSDIHISSQSNNKSLPLDITKNIYRNASKLHDDKKFILPICQSLNHNEKNSISIQQESINSNEIYDLPKSYDNIQSIDRNNNHISIPPQPRERIKNKNTLTESQSPIDIPQSHCSKVNPSHKNSSPDTSSISLSSDNTIFCIHTTDSTSSNNRNSHNHHLPYPLPRRLSLDYSDKFTNIFTKKNSNQRHINTQIYDTITPSSCYNLNRIQPLTINNESISKRVYDIPIMIERSTKCINPSFEQNKKSPNIIDEDEETTYDNVIKSDGIGKFRFVIPFNHSSGSPFTTIKPINSPSNSSSSTISSNSTMPQTSSSSNYSNMNNNNNNNNNRARLMTAV